MKRLSLLGLVGFLSSLIAGCPIYNDRYDGDSFTPTEIRPSNTCSLTSDCGVNETCGKDDRCHPGDCTFHGCSGDLTCVVDPESQSASCQPTSSQGSGSGGGPSPTDAVIWCGNPKDCATGQSCAPDGLCRAGSCTVTGCIYGYTCGASGACVRTNPAGCAVDKDCAGAGEGYSCVSGICTQPSDLCFDQTQCAAGDKCVAGKCTPSCSSSSCSAASGYACNAVLEVCSKPIKDCSITNDCGGPSNVCVNGACVPRSAGPECAKGAVWVDNGCISNQSASFVCPTDGKADGCLSSSICLHHSCYISCESDSTICAKLAQPELNECKSVTTSSGDHHVCGSKENLGNQCDPTTLKPCSVGSICIDGFCR